MKLAIFADVHSNLEALTACLDHARRHGAQAHAFVGDLVGYNADPVAVIERIAALVRDHGAIAVLGNHDVAAIRGESGSMNDAAVLANEWTRRQLRPAHVAFLESLPLTRREDDLLYVHASAVAPEKWIYIYDAQRAAASIVAGKAHLIFSGHVHDPVLYYIGRDGRPQAFVPVSGVPIPVGRHRKWLAIVGSCGQPRDGNPAASYALFDREGETLTFFRVPYDHAAAARKVRQAGLPESLARRLETGV